MSEQERRTRLTSEERRLMREQEVRQKLILAGECVLALILLIAVIVTAVRGIGGDQKRETAVPPVSEAAVLQESVREEALSASESVVSYPEEAESVAEEAVRTALPIDELKKQEADFTVDWRLVIVNPKRVLTDEFYVDVAPLSFDSDYYFDERAVDALDEMLYDCQAAGYSPIVRAGYRSWTSQQGLYENKVDEYIYDEGYSREDAEEIAATIVAYPGTSEHQLGLACDIVSEGYPKMNYTQGDAPTQQWLTAHCAEYGFILRFPEGKSDYTGIIWEGWHYRYVGKEAAREIMDRGLCLEEYLAEKGIGY